MTEQITGFYPQDINRINMYIPLERLDTFIRGYSFIGKQYIQTKATYPLDDWIKHTGNKRKLIQASCYIIRMDFWYILIKME